MSESAPSALRVDPELEKDFEEAISYEMTDHDIERSHLLLGIDTGNRNRELNATATIDAIRPRVHRASFWDGAWLPGSRLVEMRTGHDPMISAPAELTQILLGCV